jgi:5-methylcytosine-specific restriction endonuclease McrA
MICKKCGNTLTGKQISFCSEKCSKLYLKAQYRKRNAEKIRKYNKEYRKRGLGGNPSNNKVIREHIKKYPNCTKCNVRDDVQVCHIKPRHKGGKHKGNLISLCRKHHREFDILLSKFW